MILYIAQNRRVFNISIIVSYFLSALRERILMQRQSFIRRLDFHNRGNLAISDANTHKVIVKRRPFPHFWGHLFYKRCAILGVRICRTECPQLFCMNTVDLLLDIRKVLLVFLDS